MSDFAAGDYMSQKFTEFTNGQAEQYWATPHAEPKRSLPGVVVAALTSLVRVF